MKKLLKLLSLIIVLFTVILPAMAYSNAVISNVVIDEAGRMIVIEASRGETLPKPDISRMVKPNRLIIDIPGSALGTSPKLVKINNNNISLMRVIEVYAHGKHTVRIVVESEEDKIIERVKITENPNSLILQLGNLPSSETGDLPDDSKQVKITRIDYRDEQILIAGTGPIKVKPPIILKNPIRTVIDIPNAKVTDKKLLEPILVGEGQVDVVRIGQFDDNTVRVVIDTDIPRRLSTVYGENQESVVITLKQSLTDDNLALKSTRRMDISTALSQSENQLGFEPADGDLKVVIDPGHGGYDPGCTFDGFKEKDITLDVAKRVKAILEKAGIKVFMTRATDTTVSLKERVEITNNINPAAFISIHVNAAPTSAPKGISTHWYTSQSIPLAKKVQTALINKVGAVNRGVERNMFYVVHHTRVPAVLVEIGFLTNSLERVDILTHERKQNTAQGIAQGILQLENLRISNVLKESREEKKNTSTKNSEELKTK